MPFTIRALHTGLSFCSSSSTIHDSIPCVMLRYVAEESLSFLFYLYNFKLRGGYILHATWKYAIGLPILKASKDPSNRFQNHPIALTDHDEII